MKPAGAVHEYTSTSTLMRYNTTVSTPATSVTANQAASALPRREQRQWWRVLMVREANCVLHTGQRDMTLRVS